MTQMDLKLKIYLMVRASDIDLAECIYRSLFPLVDKNDLLVFLDVCLRDKMPEGVFVSRITQFRDITQEDELVHTVRQAFLKDLIKHRLPSEFVNNDASPIAFE